MHDAATRLTSVRVITFDFGNTLVPVAHRALRAVVERTAHAVADELGVHERSFLDVWAEERDRQFREEVPRFREAELVPRARRVLARLRGVEPPPAGGSWDDTAAAARSQPAEVARIVEAYSAAFVSLIPAPPGVAPMLRQLQARGFRLGVLSNWPLAASIDRFVEAAGWSPYLDALVVSERVGTIKPHPAIFRAAESALEARPYELLHVGDDWAADVVGALEAGWRVAYLPDHQHDTPLPRSERGVGHHPDFELGSLGDLPGRLPDPPA